MYQKIRERQLFSRKDDFEREKKIKNGYREPIEVLFAYKFWKWKDMYINGFLTPLL